jgi:hypothetical protein
MITRNTQRGERLVARLPKTQNSTRNRNMTTQTYTVEQAAQIAELENLIFLVRHAQSNLYFHNANLLEWLTAWCENHARIGNYSGETRLQARALNVFADVLLRKDREIYYYESNTPGLYTQEKETDEEWTARNRQTSAILARNIVLRNVPDYEDRYGIRK